MALSHRHSLSVEISVQVVQVLGVQSLSTSFLQAEAALRVSTVDISVQVVRVLVVAAGSDVLTLRPNEKDKGFF